jgi:hypothetical protein
MPPEYHSKQFPRANFGKQRQNCPSLNNIVECAYAHNATRGFVMRDLIKSIKATIHGNPKNLIKQQSKYKNLFVPFC